MTVQDGNTPDQEPLTEVCLRAAALIRKHQGEILDRWLAGARERVPASRDKGRSELADHFSELLDDVVTALAEGAPPHKLDDSTDLRRAGSASMMHGRERAVVSDYSVEQLATEYTVLRRVLVNFCREKHISQVDVLEVVNQVVEIASLTSVKSFAGAMEELRQKLASTLLHDVRTPLGVAFTYAEIMTMGAMSDAQRTQAAETVARSLRRATSMLEEMLDVARLKAGHGMAMKFYEADLNHNVQIICDEAAQVYSHEIRPQLGTEPVMGIFDVALITRTLENLISNAAKFGHDDSPITISLEEGPDWVRVWVHNFGDAIPEGDQNNIFNFFSIPTERGEVASKGWGLGLSLIKAVAANHGGEVIFESNTDKGTTFGMKLMKNYRENGETTSVLI